MWLPPRAPRSRSTSATAPRSASTLARVQPAGGAGGVEPGPPQDLVGQQVADARDPRLVEQPRLERRRAACRAPRRGRPPSASRASGPKRPSSGSSATPPSRRGSRIRSSDAVGEPQGEAVPAGLVATARVLEPVDGGGAVDEQAAGHAEAQAQSRVPAPSPPSRSSTSSLPRRRAAVTVRPVTAATTSLGRTALDEPRVRGVRRRRPSGRPRPRPGAGSVSTSSSSGTAGSVRRSDPRAVAGTPGAET